MMSARLCALSTIWPRYCWRSAASSAGCCARRARPSRPFSGVRISWLVLARKALLARLAASAWSSAWASAWSIRRRSVMSSAIQSVPAVGRMGRVDGLAEQAAPEHAAVEAAHFALELQRPGVAWRPFAGPTHERRAHVGVAWHVGPERVDAARRRAGPAAQPNMRSQLGLTCWNLPVAHEGDADRSALQDRRVFEPRALGLGDVVRVDHQVVLAGHLEARRRQPQRHQRPRPGDDHRRHVVHAAVLGDRRTPGARDRTGRTRCRSRATCARSPRRPHSP